MMAMAPFTAEERRQLAKVYQDMYEGDGPSDPPVVTRLDRIERVIDALGRLKWYFIAAIIAALGDILVGHLK